MSWWIAEGRAQSHTLWVKSQDRPPKSNNPPASNCFRQLRPSSSSVRREPRFSIHRVGKPTSHPNAHLPSSQSEAPPAWVCFDERGFGRMRGVRDGVVFFVVLEISISALPTACVFLACLMSRQQIPILQIQWIKTDPVSIAWLHDWICSI